MKAIQTDFDRLGKGAYYVRRANRESASYEEEYWGKNVIDPDGHARDLTNEREHKREWTQAEVAFINSLTPGRVLDVGCGTGEALSFIDSKWEKHGVELSQIASAEAAKYGQIYLGELKDAAYDDSFFDVVLAFHVIEHLENPLELLTQVRRVLKKGGWLILGTPDFDCAMARRFGDNFRLLHDTTHVSLFSDASLTRLLTDFGFGIEHTSYEYFETKYFNLQELTRLFDVTKVSPPFYGNILTKYCRRLGDSYIEEEIERLTALKRGLA